MRGNSELTCYEPCWTNATLTFGGASKLLRDASLPVCGISLTPTANSSTPADSSTAAAIAIALMVIFLFIGTLLYVRQRAIYSNAASDAANGNVNGDGNDDYMGESSYDISVGAGGKGKKDRMHWIETEMGMIRTNTKRKDGLEYSSTIADYDDEEVEIYNPAHQVNDDDVSLQVL